MTVVYQLFVRTLKVTYDLEWIFLYLSVGLQDKGYSM